MSTLSFDGLGMILDTGEDVEQICRELGSREVNSLILQGNTFGVQAAKRVGQEISKQQFLREAHFKDIFTSRSKNEVPIALDHLLSGISQSGTELTLLDLSDNAIGPVGSPAVEKFLRTKAASKIKKLYINNCGMGPEGGSSLAVPIAGLRLEEFIFGRNRLENFGSKFMYAALSNMKTLEVLRMPQNGIKEGIAEIARALMKNLNTIRVIDLSDNTIMVAGAEALERAIVEAKNLTELKLDDALLGNEGFSIICDAISRSRSLGTMRSVSFEGNEISGNAIIDLIEITFKDSQIEVNLLDNEFTKKELERLQSMRDTVKLIIDDPEDIEDTEDEGEVSSEDTEDSERSGSPQQSSNLVNSLNGLAL